MKTHLRSERDIQVARTTGLTFLQANVVFRRILSEEGDPLYGAKSEDVMETSKKDFNDFLTSHHFYVERDLSRAAQHTRGEWSEDDRLPFPNVYVRCSFRCPLGTVVGLHLSEGPQMPDGRPAEQPYYHAIVFADRGEYQLQTVRGFIGDYKSTLPGDRAVHAKRAYRAQDRVISSWATTFARLIVNAEVKLVEIDRSSVEERNGRKSFRLVPVPEIKEFVRSITYYVGNPGGASGIRYSGAWWVCGHWRFLRSERFERNSDGSFRRVWIPPYIKGKGRVVKQTWVLKEPRRGEPTW